MQTELVPISRVFSHSVRWSLVNALRSSHNVAVSNTGRLLLYSGERRPRIPVDNTLHKASLDALDTASTTTLALERLPAVNDDSDAAPALRSYHASAVSHIPLPYQVCQLIPLADAPAQRSGGTAIAAVTLTPAGFQVTQVIAPPLDVYTPSTDTYPPPILNMAAQEPAQYTVSSLS
ncbi:hypothetical protein L210DRAFT_3647896 [Boletus edulis BED1]|uniref:Uncharacterized protein n=1 Tax=Boletus edulis BED1 TaxID=1328754 RepID=A0AAD4BPT8_BOLED|nr:hypothetical protein L210DRAFT_3647896 [Boletus edulis BED1]